jgi:ABC-type multidrug transport system fused ATPase/permease subunit
MCRWERVSLVHSHRWYSRYPDSFFLFSFVSSFSQRFWVCSSFCRQVVASRITFDIRNKLYSAMLSQDIAFFDGTTSGDLISRLSYNTDAMVSPIQTILSSFLNNILLFGGGMILCLVTSWRLGVLAFTSISPIVQITRNYAVWSKTIQRHIWAALSEASNASNQALTNIRTVRAFGNEPTEIKKYREATESALSKAILDATASAGTYALTNYVDLGTSVLLLWYGGLLVLGKESLTLGSLIKFQLYWNMVNSAYSAIVSNINQFTTASAAAQRVLSLMDSMPDIDLTGGKMLTRQQVKGHLVIDDVSFVYQMRPENQVLKNLSLNIPAGKVCALVGRSGGGKSTIIHMLLRFYDPTQGRISLDGVDYRDLNVYSLHQQMAVVAQDTELFQGTVRENIVYGMPEDSYDEAAIIEAAKAASAHDFIMATEDGYETRVGQRGLRLSGGQRQRIAIARAILRRAPLLLLDEATSALDAESEAAVQEALDRLLALGQCTVVLVAHRLSTVVNAHNIAVIDKGVVKEQGTHDQLLKQNGIYAKLVSRQLQRAANLLEAESAPAVVAAAAGAKSGTPRAGSKGTTPSTAGATFILVPARSFLCLKFAKLILKIVCIFCSGRRQYRRLVGCHGR